VHGVVVACAARGADVAGGRLRRREVAGGDHATAAFPRVRGQDTRPWVDLGHWQAGPDLFLIILKIFKHPNFEIQNGDLPIVYNSPNFA
jgi:hypothetical protein